MISSFLSDSGIKIPDNDFDGFKILRAILYSMARYWKFLQSLVEDFGH